MAENAAVSTASATGTIVDDDAAPELSIAGGTAPEGGTIAFTVTLTGPTSRTTTVDYATAGETADEDADYEPVHGTLAFLPGESAKTVTVTLVDDDVHEDDETFTLHLSMAENAAVSTASATGTIVDDDAAPELAIAGGTAPEGGTIAFAVTLTGPTSRTTTVDYATAEETADEDADYEPVHGTLAFLPGRVRQDGRGDPCRRRRPRGRRDVHAHPVDGGERRGLDGLRHGHHRRRRCGAGTRDRRRNRARRRNDRLRRDADGVDEPDDDGGLRDCRGNSRRGRGLRARSRHPCLPAWESPPRRSR